MIIGDIKCFAVEMEYSEPLDCYLSGHLSYFIAGGRFGNYDTECSLNSAFSCFWPFFAYRQSRQNEGLVQLPYEQMFLTINNAIFGNSARSRQELERDRETFHRYLAYPVGFEVFDGWKAYLVENVSVGRLVFNVNKYDYSTIKKVDLPTGFFEDVISKLLSELGPKHDAAMSDYEGPEPGPDTGPGVVRQ